MPLYALIIGFFLLILVLTGLLNSVTLPRLKPLKPTETPKVSLLIPARNEAKIIGNTVQALLAQTYTNVELILLDDNSEDGTGEVALSAVNHDPHLRVINGTPLPNGWLGKNWACHQLAQAATGDWLIFIDADVHWEPNALDAIIAHTQRLTKQPDLLAVFPTQRTDTWTEQLVINVLNLAIICYLPAIAVHHIPWSAFSAANGQCMVFRRKAYDKIGGHESVKDFIVEDLELGREIKRNGLKLRLVYANKFVVTRMYENWQTVRDGLSKNIIAGFGNSVPFMLIMTLVHWALFIMPWVWLALGNVWAIWLIGLGITARLIAALFTQERLINILLMPISVLLITAIAANALKWRYTTGPMWKGRVMADGK